MYCIDMDKIRGSNEGGIVKIFELIVIKMNGCFTINLGNDAAW